MKKVIILLCLLIFLVGCQTKDSNVNNDRNQETVKEESEVIQDTDKDQGDKDKEPTQKKQEEKKSVETKESMNNTNKTQRDKGSDSVQKKDTETVSKDNAQGEIQVKEFVMIIANKELKVNLHDNDTVNNLVNQMPLTLKMDELNGNEKFNYLNFNLPTHSENIRNIKAGDILLFGNNCLVLFYEDYTTSYQYTRIGRIDNASDIKSLVGKGSIDITFKVKE